MKKNDNDRESFLELIQQIRHKFYLIYQNRLHQIRQMMSTQSYDVIISEISQMPSGKSKLLPKSQMSSGKLCKPVFSLIWSQYVFLIGIILCQKNRESIVEITLPKGTNIHAKEYRLYLPSKEELKQKLIEWSGEEMRKKDVK